MSGLDLVAALFSRKKKENSSLVSFAVSLSLRFSPSLSFPPSFWISPFHYFSLLPSHHFFLNDLFPNILSSAPSSSISCVGMNPRRPHLKRPQTPCQLKTKQTWHFPKISPELKELMCPYKQYTSGVGAQIPVRNCWLWILDFSIPADMYCRNRVIVPAQDCWALRISYNIIYL